MNPTIPISEPDGSEPLPICGAQREWLIARYRSDTGLALKFFSDDQPVSEGDMQTDHRAIDHVRK